MGFRPPLLSALPTVRVLVVELSEDLALS
jgi:hypothetical protein